ncbi:MAG TPA: TetR/AcrR family transcriptional regulator [Gemmatimonadales bacterium]|jgi:TetR/AcrR family transcriptional repressor of nem operon|nr:TetR/AcrR family transcriptional regulator [Gemmatimonadales bacterium]
MRVSREQFGENRQRILEVAAKRFREKGLDGIGVDGIMEEAGLTHGGFYGHFASKADLAEQACAAAVGRSTEKWEAMARARPETGLAEIARSYLSKRHRDQPGTGCVFAALGGEVARRSDGVRATVTKGVQAQLGILERVAGGRSKSERREQAIATLSGLVGAMVVARLVDDAVLSNEILTVAAAAFGGKPRDSQRS